VMSFFFAACLGDERQLSQLFPLHVLRFGGLQK
jgi:hypothetical protein